MVAATNAAMSKPMRALVSAGGLIDENSVGTSNPSGCRYSRNVYLCAMSPAGGFGAIYDAPTALVAF